MKKASKRLILWNAVFVLSLVIIMIGSFQSPTFGQTVVDEWSAVKTPQPPELKQVTVDPKTTALLLLDFNKQTCNAERRPRCIASIPQVKKLLTEARIKGSTVIYSLSAGATPADIAAELAPVQGDPIVTSGPDKFLGTDLLKILSEKKIETVIVTGTAAHGAVLYTASGAALRGMRVVLPVDGISAESLYPEQYTVWHLLNAPRISSQTTVTKIDMITFKMSK
jgi:nicotinamidase-related amidase